MPWLELKANTSAKYADLLEDALFAAGAASVTLHDAADTPIYEPLPGGLEVWPELTLIGLFTSDVDTAATLEQVAAQFPQGVEQWRWDQLEDRVWEREWLQHFQPMCFGDAFWVFHQSVDSPLPTLLLDPGLAFGTGTHPTTALCLEWIAQQAWQDKQVVDFGCGSGILAIAALMQGAAFAQCIDIDPQALIATRQNADRNHIGEHAYRLSLGEADPELTPDVLFANILAGPLIRLAPKLSACLQPGAAICLSGILDTQCDTVAEAYAPYFETLNIQQREDWVCITGVRNRIELPL